MRYFLSLLMVLTISVTAAFAQNEAVDEFTQFQNDLRKKGGAGLPGAEPLRAGEPMMPAARSRVAAATPPAVEPVDEFKDMAIAESKITAVTVYSDRAKITRVAEVDIPAGAKTIAFKNMPQSLMSETLRVQGKARADVKFGAVSSKMIFKMGEPMPSTAPLRQKLEELEDQLRAIEDEKSAVGERKAFFSKIGNQARQLTEEDFAKIDLKPDQWTASADVIYKAALNEKKALLELDLKARMLNREREQITEQLSLLQAPVERRRIFTVLVPVESDKAASLTIELSYQIPNATWQPIYDARVDTNGKGSLTLTQYGEVRQQTGEDWKGVALTLSTVRPQRGTSLPDLNAMWVNAYPPVDSGFATSAMPTPVGMGEKNTLDLPPTRGPSGDPLQEWRQKTEAKRLAMEQEEVPEQQARFVPAQIQTGGFMNEYKIPGPSNVLTDGSETKLMVGAFDADSKVQVHIKPQISTEAYLVVRTKLKGDSPVLPGQVALFRDEAYVGQSRLPLLRPGEDYDFYFGVDDQVSVKRKTLKDERKEAGLISKDSLLEREFVTEVKNLHADPVNIVVKETTPASQNEKVTVEIAPESTQGYTADTENIKGLLQWDFTMQPKEGKDLKLGWTVKWPKDHSISGL